MQYVLLTLAAAASFASAQSASLIPVGQNCDPKGTACAEGADCYAVNSMLQTVCGNFQASCTKDAQCGFNTCDTQSGLCSGFLAPSSASAASSTASSTATSSSKAEASSLSLGAQCDPLATPSPCAGGASCYASNSMLMAACGNFNAECKDDSQCAFNTCNNGFCSGPMPTSSMKPTSGMKPSGSMNGTGTAYPTGGNGSTTAPTGTHSSPPFTGAATREAGGAMAVLFAVAAWML